MSLLSRFSAFTNRHPIVRGMMSYGTLWPMSCIIQQSFITETPWDELDWLEVARFGLYGSCVNAPALYAWVKFSSKLWPSSNIQSAVKKALLEQVVYEPPAIASFFFVMSLFENRTVKEAAEEVKFKFLSTYKVGLCFWPIFQTFNFWFVPEKNRVPVISAGSLVWAVFLAYMHQLKMKQLQEQKGIEKECMRLIPENHVD